MIQESINQAIGAIGQAGFQTRIQAELAAKAKERAKAEAAEKADIQETKDISASLNKELTTLASDIEKYSPATMKESKEAGTFGTYPKTTQEAIKGAGTTNLTKNRANTLRNIYSDINIGAEAQKRMLEMTKNIKYIRNNFDKDIADLMESRAKHSYRVDLLNLTKRGGDK